MTLAERIIQVAADAIIVADASGKITLWNAGAERLFGYAAAEVVGQSLDLIIPEAQRTRHWDGPCRSSIRRRPRWKNRAGRSESRRYILPGRRR